MEILLQKLNYLHEWLRRIASDEQNHSFWKKLFRVFAQIKSLGRMETMDDFERRKLSIFNLLNFFQVCTGILIPLIGFIFTHTFSWTVWLIACLPATVSVLCLWLNSRFRHDWALMAYFVLYPFFTCIVYINGINLGADLCFILFGILSVFFLQQIGYMLFAIAFSMLSYFLLAVVLKDFRYDLSVVNAPFYWFNQLLAIISIYYALWLVKKENHEYQYHILEKNRILHNKNLQIRQQGNEIAEKARMLSTQTRELTELNQLKNKLFSIISHDLKTPMYGLRNLFKNVQQQDLPPEEVKSLIPEVVHELNSTINLMENILIWAKSQMQSQAIHVTEVEIPSLLTEITAALQVQAAQKNIAIQTDLSISGTVWADRNMLSVVIRNLLSNAIKFTPSGGNICITAREGSSLVEISIQDSGVGMSGEELEKLNEQGYYSTPGTDNEQGTGLGLMLCKEFLAKNRSHLHIETLKGQGSRFSFSLPRHRH